jgi:PmbA protein
MMKDLLRSAKENSDAAEVYLIRRKTLPLEFENGALQKVNLRSTLEVALRVIRDGKLGFSFGTSLDSPRVLVDQAVRSAQYGPSVDFQFPSQSSGRECGNFDPDIKNQSAEDLARSCFEQIEWLKERAPDSPISAAIETETQELTIMNTSGVDVTYEKSSLVQYYMLVLEGSGVGPFVEDVHYGFRKIDPAKLQRLCDLYRLSKKSCPIPTRKMKVLLTPHSIGEIVLWRIESGVSGRSLVDQITPLQKKKGERICDERITIVEDPLASGFVGSRPFDDEGVPTRKLPIVERGVFKNFVFDLNTAAKLKTESTGNGYKTTMWGGDISTPVTAYLRQPVFGKGDLSENEMVKQMDEGIILDLANGAHSGNIPAGFFSVNVGYGLYVKDGEIQGRAADAMVSGNIYDLIQNIHSLSVDLDWKGLPSLLLNDVSVAGES